MTRTRLRCVIFDMAGTFVDEDNTVYKTIRHTLQDVGIDLPLNEILIHAAGKEKREAIEDILRSKDIRLAENAIDVLYHSFRQKLSETYQSSSFRVFSSVEYVVDVLRKKGVRIAINTGYNRALFDLLTAPMTFDFEGKVDVIITADEVGRGRPEPDMILEICRRLQLYPSQCFKVGDSKVDVLEGQNADVLCSIGITTGAQNYDTLSQAKPEYIIEDMLHLLPIAERYMFDE